MAGQDPGESTRESVIAWIEAGGVAKVKSGATEVQVHVVNASPKYVQTYANGSWTDNLLTLPRF